MASVTFPVSVGGDGSTVSDDSSPTTGLGNGGHRTRFVPALSQVVAVASNTVTQATNAAASASSASTSATLAQNAPGTQATTTTSLTIALGSQSLTLAQTGKNFVVGQYVQIVSTASTQNWMVGAITAFTSGTGAMTVNVTHIGGSGTIAAWAVTPGLPPNLPSQSGNANRVLKTNGSVASWADPVLPVGASITGNTTLVATDAQVRAVAMAVRGNCITLPSATTLANGWEYVFDNTGSRDFGVRSNGGLLIGTVQPGVTARFTLIDNSTAAGVWGTDGNNVLMPLTVADTQFDSGSYGGTTGYLDPYAIVLSSTLSLHFVRDSNGYPYVFAVDCSTYPATVGAPVAIATSTSAIGTGIAISSTKALIVLATSALGYHVTVSGTTCTVSSASAQVIGDGVRRWQGMAGNGSFYPASVLVGSGTRVLSIDLNGTTRLVDVSGATPTLVTSASYSASLPSNSQNVAYLFKTSESSAVGIVSNYDSGATQYQVWAVGISYSGTTITVGTPTKLSTTYPQFSGVYIDFAVAQLSATSYVVTWAGNQGGASPQIVRGFTISGTTITASTETIVSNSSGQSPIWKPMELGASTSRSNFYVVNSTTALLSMPASNNYGTIYTLITFSGGTIAQPSQLFAGAYNLTPTYLKLANFCQSSTGWIGVGNVSGYGEVLTFTINGTALSIAGASALPAPMNSATAIDPASSGGIWRNWSLSGGYGGVMLDGTKLVSGRFELFRYRAGNAPQVLGSLSLTSSQFGDAQSSNWYSVPAELASNRIAFMSVSTQSIGSSLRVPKFQILEFPA